MGEIRLFHVIYGGAHELVETPFHREKELQRLFEAQLAFLTGIDFLASEYPADHYGRIDTLGIDEQGCPVVIEYKRIQNESIINQGLHYLEWLKSHRANIELLVRDAPEIWRNRRIDFRGAWLLCVARDFTEWDLSTVKEVSRRVELVRCRRYGGELGSNLVLEWVWPEKAIKSVPQPRSKPQSPPLPPVFPHSSDEPDFSLNERWNRADKELKDLFAELRTTLEAFGNDVRVEPKKKHIGFTRKRVFASALLMTGNRCLLVYVKLDPDSVKLEPGFTQDKRGKGHWGTGDLEVTLRSRTDIKKARPLLREAYERT